MVIRSVLCPVDFSEASRAALRAAVRVARQFKATLHVLFVEDPLLASAAAITAPAETDLHEELEQFVTATPDLDPPSEPTLHVAVGQPAEEIVRFADREHIDAIVMGTHGLTGSQKAFLWFDHGSSVEALDDAVVDGAAVGGCEGTQSCWTGLDSRPH